MAEKKLTKCEELFNILAGLEAEAEKMGEATLYGSGNVRPGAMLDLEVQRWPIIHAIKKCSGLKDDHEVYKRLNELRKKRKVFPDMLWEEKITDDMVQDFLHNTDKKGGGCGCGR